MILMIRLTVSRIINEIPSGHSCPAVVFHNDAKLPESTKDIICSNVEVSVSIATLWEIAIKKSLGKLDIPESVSELEQGCIQNDIGILPIKTIYLEQIGILPFIHRDPFDRLIMATAVEEGLTLITCDEKIQKYNINILW